MTNKTSQCLTKFAAAMNPRPGNPGEKKGKDGRVVEKPF